MTWPPMRFPKIRVPVIPERGAASEFWRNQPIPTGADVTIPAALLVAVIDWAAHAAADAVCMDRGLDPQCKAQLDGWTGRTGWRACLTPEQAVIINQLEHAGLAVFVEP